MDAHEQLKLWTAERERLLQFMLVARDTALLDALKAELASVERSIQALKQTLAKQRH